MLCTIFRVAKRGGRCCIGRLLRPSTLRARGTPKWPFSTKSLFLHSLRSEDLRSQDSGSRPIEPVLSDAGDSRSHLGTIFRVTSRLERWCIARLLRPPHSRAPGTPKSAENTKNLRISDSSQIDSDLRSQDPGSGPFELVLSDAGESGGDLGTVFRVST